MDKEVVEKLIKEDEDFKKKFKTHKDFERKIERLEKKSHLTPEEAVEKNRLKKLKLALKDEMERKLAESSRKRR
jgi:uncharacterized protein